MKNKIFFVFSLVILVVLLGSCGSSPSQRVDTVPANSLSGKTVFLEIEMAEWDRKLFPLMDAAAYNRGLDRSAEEFKSRQKQKVAEMWEQAATHYKNTYNVEIGYDKYPMVAEFELDYFSQTSNSDISRKISEICSRRGDDFAFTLIGQMHTTGVSGFGVNGANQLSFNMVLFDKTGKIVTKGEVSTPKTKIKSSDVNGFIMLFDEANGYIKSIIDNMGKR